MSYTPVYLDYILLKHAMPLHFSIIQLVVRILVTFVIYLTEKLPVRFRGMRN